MANPSTAPKKATVTRLVRPAMSAEQKAAEKADPTLKFRRLANKRVNAAIKALNSVQNLAGSAYGKGRTDENVAAIVRAVGGKTNALIDAFNKTEKETQSFSI